MCSETDAEGFTPVGMIRTTRTELNHSCSMIRASRIDVLMDGFFMCSKNDAFYYPSLTVNCK